MPSEDKLWLPPLSPKDQEKFDRLRKKKKGIIDRAGFSGRTLWDWLNLLRVLAIPFVVTVMGLYFTQQITQQQVQLSDKQHQTDLQIAIDQQREATLKTYLDDMSSLLLDRHLRTSKPDDEVRLIARTKTLTALQRLDGDRKATLIQFLYRAGLIIGDNKSCCTTPLPPIISLDGADLNKINLNGAFLPLADLSGAYLEEAHLEGARLDTAILIKADLQKADLHEAVLYSADLEEANLEYANLHSASLNSAKLGSADLSHADLSHAILRDYCFEIYCSPHDSDLFGANLSYANLRDAAITTDQLATAKSLKGATMPDGSTHP